MKLLLAMVAVIILASCSKEDSKKELTESSVKLQKCAEEILIQNKEMMGEKPFGNWKMLNEITVESRSELIYITWYINIFYTHQGGDRLRFMQRIFTKNAGCSPSIIRVKII